MKEYRKAFGDWFEMVGVTCPVCGHKGHCLINQAQTEVACTRAREWNGQSGIPMGSAGFKFSLTGEQQAPSQDLITYRQEADVPQYRIRTHKQLDVIYRSVLKHTVNREKFTGVIDDLHRRGLSDMTIERWQITPVAGLVLASCTDRDANDVQHLYLRDETENFNGFNYADWFVKDRIPENAWQGVPGFYQWHFTDNDGVEKDTAVFYLPQSKAEAQPVFAGFKQKQEKVPYYNPDAMDKDYFIPCQDIDGNIFAMQARHQDPKFGKYTWVSSSGKDYGTQVQTGVNVALVPSLDRKRRTTAAHQWLHNTPKTVILTEGVLKAIVAAEHLEQVYSAKERQQLGNVVLGNGGVTQWKQFLPVLKELKAVNVVVAYDMDYQGKEQVAQAQKELIDALKAEGYHVAVAHWDPKDKGIDDALQHGQRLDLEYLQ